MLNLSCTIIPALSLKVKLLSKHFLKHMLKQAFIASFQFSKTFVKAKG